MVTSRSADRAGSLHRFDGLERALHWANAVLFVVVLTSAAALYFGPLSAVVGRRELVRAIHVYSGLALPLPFVAAFVLGRRWHSQLGDDVRRLNRWIDDDRRWLRSLGRDRRVRLGKFHPGQKINAAYLAGGVPVMVLTGSIMKWFEPFPLSWRTGATFVHDWVALGFFVLVTGHVLKAVADRDAMHGILTGWVDEGWATARHPRWREEDGKPV